MSDAALTLEQVLEKVGFTAQMEAEARGIAIGKEDIAWKALSEGASVDFVQRITGLDLEAIKTMN